MPYVLEKVVGLSITKVFLTDSGWAYAGVYQSIGNLPGIQDSNEKLWTMLGALLMELSRTGVYEVVIYNDTRLIEEWYEEIDYLSPLSLGVARRLKDIDGLSRQFVSLSLEKLDRVTIDSEIRQIRLV